MPESKKKETKQKIVLVTGGTSGLGIRLIKKLLEKGYQVRTIVREHPSTSDEWRSLPGGVIPYVADFTFRSEKDKETLLLACKDVDYVFHIGGATYNFKFKFDELVNTNVVGTENLITAYFDANPDPNKHVRFIYTSSVTVYGYNRAGETLNEDSSAKPASAYSESKLMAEKVIESYDTAHERLDYTIFRLGVIYGPGYERAFYKIFKLLKEKSLRNIGAGKNHLTFVHVDDVVDAILLAIDTQKSTDKVYNLTDGVPYTLKELFAKAASFMGVEAPTKSIHPFIARIGARTRGLNMDEFEFLVSDRIISIERIKKELGFKPSRRIDIEGKAMADMFLHTLKQ